MSETEKIVKFREGSILGCRKETTRKHAALQRPWVTCLAGLVFFLCALLGPLAAAWDNVPDENTSCVDPVNYGEDGCSLWRSVKEACIDGEHYKWHHEHCCYNELLGPDCPVVLVKNSKHTDNCHFMVVPTVGVIGVEDKDNRDKYPYWWYAWLAATLPAEPIKVITLNKSVGLAVNPQKHRTQHQLHIHIAQTKYSYRNLLTQNHVPHDGKWHQLPAEKVKNKTCYAKFIPCDPAKGPFPSPFKEVSAHFGEKNMKHAGIVVAGAADGLYYVSCYDTCVEYDWLYYNCPYQ